MGRAAAAPRAAGAGSPNLNLNLNPNPNPNPEPNPDPELQALCDAGGGRACGYVDGNLIAEVHDLRAPEHAALGVETRVIPLTACDDDLMLDIQELEYDAVLNGAPPWTDLFKQKLEAMLRLHPNPEP